jgi:hypothetical protein
VSNKQRALMASDLIDGTNGPFGFSGSREIDLAEAEPLAKSLRILDRAREESPQVYAIFWVNRVVASGCSVSVCWMRLRDDDDREGTVDAGCIERLFIGEPCDGHMEERRVRMDALREHLRASEGARQAVIDYVNQSGHFSDNRPFSSAAEAVECAIGAGIRLMVNREGELEPSTSFSGDFIDHDSGGGWTMRRTWQRFQSSCHRPEWKQEIINIIRQRGAVHEGSGWIVLERNAEPADLVEGGA